MEVDYDDFLVTAPTQEDLNVLSAPLNFLENQDPKAVKRGPNKNHDFKHRKNAQNYEKSK